ncbi:hypothetical protein RIF29_26349 [Crotalaria pallida]|uniref:Uncharacterized protein n=1 Tax=Crotalaria pallida TaxID=3830 RepID=A0AAN9I0B0_CROPI
MCVLCSWGKETLKLPSSHHPLTVSLSPSHSLLSLLRQSAATPLRATTIIIAALSPPSCCLPRTTKHCLTVAAIVDEGGSRIASHGSPSRHSFSSPLETLRHRPPLPTVTSVVEACHHYLRLFLRSDLCDSSISASFSLWQSLLLQKNQTATMVEAHDLQLHLPHLLAICESTPTSLHCSCNTIEPNIFSSGTIFPHRATLV